MSTKAGTIVLLVGSELLGTAAGEVFYRLFLRTLPPFALSQFSGTAAHMAFLTYGFGLGFVIFLWTVLATWLGRMHRTREIARPD